MDRHRRTAWLLTVGLLPAVLLGLILTASIFGAPLGIPLLAVVGRPWWIAVRALRGRGTIGVSARRHTELAVGLLTGAFIVGVLVGLDDLSAQAGDVLIVGTGVMVLAACWAGLAGQHNLQRLASRERRSSNL